MLIGLCDFGDRAENLFLLSEKKFYNVSEQVKNFKMYQSKLNFLRCIKAS